MTTRTVPSEPKSPARAPSLKVAPGRGPGGAPPSRGTSPAQTVVVDEYCEICWAPCQLTDLGPLCAKHYRDRRPLCESCGNRPADIVEAGYYICGSCRNGGRY